MTKNVTLSNGIRVVTEELSYLRTASFGVWVKVGSAKETKRNNGISHMIEHMMFKGTTKRTSRELADLMAGIGDDVNAFTGKEVTCYYGTTTTQQLPVLIDLLGDMLLHSKFDEADIRKEKRVIYDEIDMYEDSADDMVHELLQQKVYDNQALGYIISGTKSNVRSFKRQQILDFIKKHYTADNMLISVAGNFDEKALLEQLEAVFKEVPAVNSSAAFAKSVFEKKAAMAQTVTPYERKYQTEKNTVYHPCFCTRHKENEQLHMNIAYPCISLRSTQGVIFSLFNSMFGGSNNSRLFQKIREELSLVYSIYSYGSAFEKEGLFHIDITVSQAQALTVLKETKKVMDDFLNHEITMEELNTHKAQVKTELIMSSESTKTRMDANAKGMLLRGYVKSLDEVLAEIDAVTVSDIKTFANTVFMTEKPSMCVIGTENQVSFRKIKKEFETHWQLPA